MNSRNRIILSLKTAACLASALIAYAASAQPCQAEITVLSSPRAGDVIYSERYRTRTGQQYTGYTLMKAYRPETKATVTLFRFSESELGRQYGFSQDRITFNAATKRVYYGSYNLKTLANEIRSFDYSTPGTKVSQTVLSIPSGFELFFLHSDAATGILYWADWNYYSYGPTTTQRMFWSLADGSDQKKLLEVTSNSWHDFDSLVSDATLDTKRQNLVWYTGSGQINSKNLVAGEVSNLAKTDVAIADWGGAGAWTTYVASQDRLYTFLDSLPPHGGGPTYEYSFKDRSTKRHNVPQGNHDGAPAYRSIDGLIYWGCNGYSSICSYDFRTGVQKQLLPNAEDDSTYVEVREVMTNLAGCVAGFSNFNKAKPADVNGDGVVNNADYTAFRSAGPQPRVKTWPNCDFLDADNNGVFDYRDQNVVSKCLQSKSCSN